MDSASVCRCFAPATRDGVYVAVTISKKAALSVPMQVTILSLNDPTALGCVFAPYDTGQTHFHFMP